jgi:hypothetical protein
VVYLLVPQAPTTLLTHAVNEEVQVVVQTAVSVWSLAKPPSLPASSTFVSQVTTWFSTEMQVEVKFSYGAVMFRKLTCCACDGLTPKRLKPRRNHNMVM